MNDCWNDSDYGRCDDDDDGGADLSRDLTTVIAYADSYRRHYRITDLRQWKADVIEEIEGYRDMELRVIETMPP